MCCHNPDCRQTIANSFKFCPHCGAPTTLIQKPCANCWGLGTEVSPRFRGQCSVCRGRGQVSVEPPGQTCQHCDGKGSDIGLLYVKKCLACLGSGWAQAHFILKQGLTRQGEQHGRPIEG